jgi:hypothetical protein
MTRERLDELTDRWRRRSDARRPTADERPAADPAREALAARAFPYRSVSPRAYVDAHGGAMTGFTYDHERYGDAELDAWLLELGRLLRARSEEPG